MEVTDGPAIRDKVSFKSPVLSEELHKSWACAARLSVCTVVSSHDRLDTGFAYKRLERRQISLGHVLWGSDRVELVPYGFRSAVYREMLGAGRCLQRLSIALQAMYKSLAQAGCQIRIFSVCLMTAAPSRVTEYVYVWGPHRKSVIDIPVAFRGKDIVSCPRFR